MPVPSKVANAVALAMQSVVTMRFSSSGSHSEPGTGISRREVLRRIGGGFGALGMASVFADAGFLSPRLVRADSSTGRSLDTINPLAPRSPHFEARAKRVIFLFMNGGPSHVDTFDPKPMLAKYEGQTPQAAMVMTGRKQGTGLMPSPFKSRPC